MVGSVAIVSKNQKFFVEYRDILKDILMQIDLLEKKMVHHQTMSKFDLEQLNYIRKEIQELNQYAQKGTVYFKYGKRQRTLDSSYIVTDSLSNFTSTQLGKQLNKLQDLYSRL